MHIAGNIGEATGAAVAQDAPGLDHVAFRTQDFAAAKERLRHAGLPWKEVWHLQLGILQLVLHDPAGTKVELTFDSSERPGDATAPTVEN